MGYEILISLFIVMVNLDVCEDWLRKWTKGEPIDYIGLTPRIKATPVKVFEDIENKAKEVDLLTNGNT